MSTAHFAGRAWTEALTDALYALVGASLIKNIADHHDGHERFDLIRVAPGAYVTHLDAIGMVFDTVRLCQRCHHLIRLGPTGWDHERFARYECGGCN